jgi:hypothetical protein
MNEKRDFGRMPSFDNSSPYAALLTDISFAAAIALLLFLFCAIKYMDFREPLAKDQVRRAVSDYVKPDGREIRRISFYKDEDAGDLGYYFVELKPAGYIIVIDDARFFISEDTPIDFPQTFYDSESRLMFFEFIITRTSLRGDPFRPNYRSTLTMKFESLVNKMLFRKTPQEIFWESYAAHE